MPPEMLKSIKPEFVSPLVGVLCAKDSVGLSLLDSTLEPLLTLSHSLRAFLPSQVDCSRSELVSSRKSDGSEAREPSSRPTTASPLALCVLLILLFCGSS
jgi:hypothetical protein